MFDRTSGAPKGEVKIPGATFLNDVAAADGVVYVADTALDAKFKPGPRQGIWEIRDGKPKQLARGADLGGPNGLLAHGGELWVVTFGSGELYRIGRDGKRADIEKLPKGALDGIVAGPDGALFISSWEGQAVFTGKPAKGGASNFAPAIENVKSPADIGIDTKRSLLLVPLFEGNRVEMHPLERDPTGPEGAPTP
jgi:sugar lactone lactonase YvrE